MKKKIVPIRYKKMIKIQNRHKKVLMDYKSFNTYFN